MSGVWQGLRAHKCTCLAALVVLTGLALTLTIVILLARYAHPVVAVGWILAGLVGSVAAQRRRRQRQP